MANGSEGSRSGAGPGATTDSCDRLGFILAAPALTSGARTLNMAARTATILGFRGVHAANLFAEPTWNTGELNVAGSRPEGWLGARAGLVAVLDGCDHVVAAWGVTRCSGAARFHQREQVNWLLGEAARRGHAYIWTLGGEPRHPSRWHQYVSESHGRAGEGPLDVRLRSQLRRVKIGEFPGFNLSRSA